MRIIFEPDISLAVKLPGHALVFTNRKTSVTSNWPILSGLT